MNFLKSSLFATFAVGILSACSGDESSVKYFAAKLDGDDKYSIIEAKSGEVVVKDEFVDVVVDDEFLIVKEGEENSSYSIYTIDDIKKPIISDLRECGRFGDNNRTLVTVKEKPISIIDRSGKQVVELPKEITSAQNRFSDGLAVVEKNDSLYGYIDDDGKMVIEPKFLAAAPFFDGLAVVSVKAGDKVQFQVIDKKGNVVFKVKDKYTNVDYKFHNGYLAVSDNENVVLLNEKGEVALKNSRLKGSVRNYIVDEDCTPFYDGDAWGLMSIDGEVVVRAKYQSLRYVGSGIFIAENDDKYDFLNAKGDVISTIKCDRLKTINSSVFLKRDGSSYTLVDGDDKEVTKDEYEFVEVVEPWELKYDYDVIQSDYFDVDGTANDITKEITKDSCLGIKSMTTPADMQKAGIITDSADSHTYSSSLTNDHSFGSLGSFYVDYSFDNYITTPIVENKTEYYYGYAYTYQQTTGYKYSETACIKSLSFSVSLGRFSSHSEKTVEAIKSKLIAKGFKDDGTGSLLSDKGTKITIQSGEFSDDIILTYYFQSVDDFVDAVAE